MKSIKKSKKRRKKLVNFNWVSTSNFNRNPIFVVRFKFDRVCHLKLKSEFELTMTNQLRMANGLSSVYFSSKKIFVLAKNQVK